MSGNCRLRSLILCLALGLLLPIHLSAQGRPQDFTNDPSLLRFLEQLADATHQFNVGNPEPYLALLSPNHDLTLMGAAGGMEKGIEQIRPRLNLLTQRRKEASGFAENRAVIEYVSVFARGDLAYTVQIERRQLASKDQQPRRDDNLRATHVLRRENGLWKLVHRQADPLVDVTIPDLAPRK